MNPAWATWVLTAPAAFGTPAPGAFAACDDGCRAGAPPDGAAICPGPVLAPAALAPPFAARAAAAPVVTAPLPGCGVRTVATCSWCAIQLSKSACVTVNALNRMLPWLVPQYSTHAPFHTPTPDESVVYQR